MNLSQRFHALHEAEEDEEPGSEEAEHHFPLNVAHVV